MTERFTSFIEDDGYWIRDERNCKIIATGLKFGVSENLTAKLNKLNAENIQLGKENKELKQQLQQEHTMLDNAIHLERTRMGKNSLIQYKEAIQ